MKPFDPRLLRTLPAARGPLVQLGVLGIAQGIAAIASTIAVTHLVVAAVTGSALTTPTVATVGVFALRAGLAALAERRQAAAASVVSTTLRERLIASWLRQDPDHRTAADPGLALATQGATAVEPYVARFLPSLIAATVVPVLAVAVLLWVDWVSALIVIFTVPLLPMFAALIGMTTRDETQRRWQALADLSGHFLDVMRGLPTLVNYGRARRQVATIEQVSQRHREATMRTLKLAFVSSAALELLATISVAMVAVSVGIRLTTAHLNLTTGMLAILIAPEAFWPVRRVGAEFHSAADGTEALEAILDQLEQTPAAVQPDTQQVGADSATLGTADAGQVRATQVSYRYPGSESDALAPVSFSASSGLTAVTGASGCGKTTLLEVLAGLRCPTSGTVRSPTVHLVTQRPFLSAGTLHENLALGNHACEESMWEALRAVGLDGMVTALPEGLHTTIGDDGFGLSSGQRARLVLARALLSRASVVLLDEPTAHVDAASREALHEVIEQMATRRTVIVVTHDNVLVRRAHQHVQLAVTEAPAAFGSSS